MRFEFFKKFGIILLEFLEKKKPQMNILKDYYNKLEEEYGKGRILGVFVLGDYNVGLKSNYDESDIFAIYLPTFEEMVMSLPKLNFKVMDIRNLYEATKYEDWDSLEILFTNEYYLNPLHASTFTRLLLENREEIASYSKSVRINKTLVLISKAQDNPDDKLAVGRAYRSYVALSMYLKENYSTEECYHIKDEVRLDYINSVAKGMYFDNQIQTMYDRVNEFKQEYLNEKANMGAAALIKTGILEIMKEVISGKVDYSSFVESLNEQESKALFSIVEKIKGSDKNIVISKLVTETAISRAVYNKLIIKLRNSKIAEVENNGAKGLSIKFTIPID